MELTEEQFNALEYFIEEKIVQAFQNRGFVEDPDYFIAERELKLAFGLLESKKGD